MNGGQALIRTLVECGVDTCFMNPGTSEMHFVAALDDVPDMRSVLALFEGVATGAADGFARMAGRPAATLLHLGPGLGNGIANLHNARKARTPVVNIVGDHATYHKKYNAQLESDIETLARNVSSHIRWCTAPGAVGADVVDTIAAAQGPPGQVATLILPADVSWSEGGRTGGPAPARRAELVDEKVIEEIAAALGSGEPACILLGGRAGRADALSLAGAVAARTGARLLCETFATRLERGAGRVPIERLPYLGEMAMAQLQGLRHLVLIDTPSPVSFFAYPGKPSDLVPEGCRVHVLCPPSADLDDALARLAERLGADAATAPRAERSRPAAPSGPLSADAVCAVVGELLPEGAIVSDEANTSGLFSAQHTAGAPPHDWLSLTGGAIGQGLPVALGAAVACPDRRVIALQADGSSLYTLQAWWTMAREGLDVTTVLFNNRSYSILNLELSRVGAGAGGPRAKEMLDLSRPDLDFCALARGMGVEAGRATTTEEFRELFARALASPGPTVVEVVVPGAF